MPRNKVVPGDEFDDATGAFAYPSRLPVPAVRPALDNGELAEGFAAQFQWLRHRQSIPRQAQASNVVIRLPGLDELALRWWSVAPILKRATDRAGGAYEPIDVLRDAFLGQVGIWIIEDDAEDIIAVAVAGVRQFPRQRVIQISFVAGKRLVDWWSIFVDEIDKLAKAAGAGKIYAYGRPGWVRFWKARGVAQHVTSEMLVRTL